MQYNWLFFDADNTLFDFDLAAKTAFKQLLNQLEIDSTAERFKQYKSINAQCWRAFEEGEINAEELRRKRFADFFAAIEVERDPLQANSNYLQRLSEQAVLLEGALDLLNRLKSKGYRMVIITNGLKEVQRPRLAKAALHDYFETIVVSDEIGHAKPAAAFFDYTFQQIDHPAKEETLVIGDNINSDIRGGYDYGLDTCWYNPHRQENVTPIRPTFEIQQLQELESLLL